MTTAFVKLPDVTPYRWTLPEYMRLGEVGIFADKRVELIRGEIIEMSPMGSPHYVAIALVAQTLQDTLGPGFWVRSQGPIDLPMSQPIPDVSVVRGAIRDYRTDNPTTAELIVEVAESTLRYDLTTKLELYAEAGVPEYWVVNLVKRVVHVFREPVETRLGKHNYGSTLIVPEKGSVTSLLAPETNIRVQDLLP
jgi:Uma2 family endonuclease